MQHDGGETEGASAAPTATRGVELPQLVFDYEVHRSACLALGGATWVLTAEFRDREPDAWQWRLTRFRSGESQVLVRGTSKTEADAFIALRDALAAALHAPPAAAAADPAPGAAP